MMTEQNTSKRASEPTACDDDVEIRTYAFEVGRSPRSDRIDKYLSHRFPDYSRTFIQKLIKDGGIIANGNPVKSSYTPVPGDRIVAKIPTLRKERIEPEEIDLDIIYEDEWLIVVNKPSDIVVHPSRGHQSGTLVNGVAYHCKKLSERGGALRPGIVHRLDRDTTGVILMVKDESVHEEIARQFEHRKVKKEYVAICEGHVELDSDIIEARIGNHPRAKEKMSVRPDTGKTAKTIYKVAERIGNFTIIRCFPHSGRTHQIRVHLRHLGHPVVCDAQYGHRKTIYLSDLTGGEHHPAEKPLLARQALHARRLTIYHPELGKDMTFEAELPADMRSFIDALRDQIH
jgi:23S rRNA pseudouridine1911/1915/1917 synthase